MFVNDYQNSNKKKKGFYIAAGVCVFAIFAVICSTYQSAKEFISFDNNSCKSTVCEPALLDEIEYKEDENLNKQEILNTEKLKDKVPEKMQEEKQSDFSSDVQPANAKVTDEPLSPMQQYFIAEKYSGDLIFSHEMGDWRSHDFIKVKIDKNKEIYAFGNGKVESINDDNLNISYKDIYGKNYKNMLVTYSGLDRILVRTNQEIKLGVPLGKAKDNGSGQNEGEFLVQATKDGERINPEEFFLQ